MNQQQIARLTEIAQQDPHFYLTCKSAAANLEIPYPGQFADRINHSLSTGQWSRDTEYVALEILRSDAIKTYLDQGAAEYVALFARADEIASNQ